MPLSVVCVMMQLFIPVNTLVSRYVCKRKEHKRHIVISCAILIGVILSLGSLYKSYKDK